MNTDDFEKRLQEQELRPVPGHWRNQILQQARGTQNREVEMARAERRALPGWLHQLLWPCPQAWGALAAVWVVVLFLNFAGSEKAEVTVAKAPDQSSEVRMAVKQQSQFRAELMSANDAPAAEPPKMSAPQSGLKPSVQTMAA
ncbi:MAG: hypothetical protein ACXWJB_11200 [Limisphaerales bacterium]